MTQPIVFISHSAIRDGQVEGFRAFIRAGAPVLEADKPGTLAFLAYLDEDGSRASIVHVFPNADAMNAHLEGVQERSEEADAFIETTAYEIYGSPDAPVVQMMRAFAERSGVPLTVHPEHVGGYLHG
jgi:quinol monooxygenase YgiN